MAYTAYFVVNIGRSSPLDLYCFEIRTPETAFIFFTLRPQGRKNSQLLDVCSQKSVSATLKAKKEETFISV